MLKQNKVEELNKAFMVRPWVRYWARIIDISLFSLVLGFILGIIDACFLNGILFGETGILSNRHNFLLGMLSCFSWIFIETLLLYFCGTTPGKALLRIQCMTKDDSKISLISSFKRSLLVWYYGFGIGFPLVTLGTLYISYNNLVNKGNTVWDSKGNFVVSHKEIGVLRAGVASLIVLSIYGMKYYRL